MRPTHDREVFTGVVALVDDDLSVRRALSRLLHSVGIESLVVAGPGFLTSPAIHEVACLVLDVHLPGLSRTEVLDEVQVAATKLPVVLISGRYEDDFAKRAIAAGASAFLGKPFTEEELFDALERATGQWISR